MPSAAVKLQRRREALSVLVASIPPLPELEPLPAPRRGRRALSSRTPPEEQVIPRATQRLLWGEELDTLTGIDENFPAFIPYGTNSPAWVEETADIPTCLEWHDGFREYRPIQGDVFIIQFASPPPMRWTNHVVTRVCFVATLEHTAPYRRELVYRQRPQDDGTYYARPML